MWQLNPQPLLLVSHRTKAWRSLLQCQTSHFFFQCMCVFVCLLPLHYEALYSLYSQCSASRPQVSHWGSEKVKVVSSRFGCQKSWSLQTWKAWGTSWWYKACVIWDPPPHLFAQERPCCWPNAVAAPLSQPKAPGLITYMFCQLYARCFFAVLRHTAQRDVWVHPCSYAFSTLE